MIIVAYLYNTNGMASWCWEAAHALHEAGQTVRLVCSESVTLPADCQVPVIRFDPPTEPRDSVRSKLLGELSRLSAKSSGFVWELHQQLGKQGIQPTAYLLNQTDLQDERVPVPQYVTAWAYPTTLRGYSVKIGTYSGWKLSRSTVRALLSTLGWWRKDWRAYRSATGVLAVSQRLHTELTAQGVNSVVVHPGTEVQAMAPRDTKPPTKLLTVALDLEDFRKRVRWLVEALHRMPDWSQFSLTLIGKASPEFRAWVSQNEFPATFTGPLPRAQVQTEMAKQDIFLFGSALDDWGYVLIEAMSRNLCTVAPNISPFDEIVGDTGVLYNVNSQTDLTQKLSALLAEPIGSYQQAASQRAETLFSRAAFSRSLLAMMKTAEAA